MTAEKPLISPNQIITNAKKTSFQLKKKQSNLQLFRSSFELAISEIKKKTTTKKTKKQTNLKKNFTKPEFADTIRFFQNRSEVLYY